MKKKIILFVTFVFKKIGIGLENFEILESCKQTSMDNKNILSKLNEELINLCEHNFHKNRNFFYKFLKIKGYSLKYSGLSRWDDCYFKDRINIIQ